MPSKASFILPLTEDKVKGCLKGHGKLLAKGVLHRDIVPWNVLIDPRANEGSRGALIDLECGTRTVAPSARVGQSPVRFFIVSQDNSSRNTNPYRAPGGSFQAPFSAGPRHSPIWIILKLFSTFLLLCYCAFRSCHCVFPYDKPRRHRRLRVTLDSARFEGERIRIPPFQMDCSGCIFQGADCSTCGRVARVFSPQWWEVKRATGAQQIIPPGAPAEDYTIFVDHFSCAIDKLSLLCVSYRSIAPNKGSVVFGAALPSNYWRFRGQ
jgi:hypothetical protein